MHGPLAIDWSVRSEAITAGSSSDFCSQLAVLCWRRNMADSREASSAAPVATDLTGAPLGAALTDRTVTSLSRVSAATSAPKAGRPTKHTTAANQMTLLITSYFMLQRYGCQESFPAWIRPYGGEIVRLKFGSPFTVSGQSSEYAGARTRRAVRMRPLRGSVRSGPAPERPNRSLRQDPGPRVRGGTFYPLTFSVSASRRMCRANGSRC